MRTYQPITQQATVLPTCYQINIITPSPSQDPTFPLSQSKRKTITLTTPITLHLAVHAANTQIKECAIRSQEISLTQITLHTEEYI